MAKIQNKKGVGIIPKRTQNLEDHAFSECKDLTCVVIPDSVERIGENAFNGCTSLTSIVIHRNWSHGFSWLFELD